jgi:HAE1 family hydrophobic/amphiphilic exporter-1
LLAAGASLEPLPLVAAALATILVVRQSALLLSAARERRAQDLNDRVSVIAAGRARLRPTLLSAVAMIAAIVPVALANGGAEGLHRTLVIGLIGGILTSSAVSLLVVPPLYATLEDAMSVLATRYRARLARRERRIRTLPRADDEGVMSA